MCSILAFSNFAPLASKPHRPRSSPRRCRPTFLCSTTPEENPSSPSDSDPSWNLLSQRVSRLRQQEIARDRRLAHNWQQGVYTQSVIATAKDDYVRKVAFRDDLLAFGTTSGDIVLSDLSSGKQIQYSNAHVGQVTALHFDKSLIASAGANDFSVAVWNCADYQRPRFWASQPEIYGNLGPPFLEIHDHDEIVTEVIVDTAQNRLYTSCIDGIVRVFSLDDGKPLFTIPIGEPIFCMILTEKKYLLLGCRSGRVQAYQAERGMFLLSIPCHASNTTALDFFEDNQTLVSGDSSGVIRVWSFQDSTCVGEIPGHNGAIMSLQVDHSKVVSAGRDGCVNVAMLQNLQHLFTISGFTKYLSSAYFDEKRLIADGTDDVVVCNSFDVAEE